MIKTFCVTHKTLEFPLPSDIPVVWMGGSQPEVAGNNPIYRLAEISEELDAWHNFLAGSAGTFAVEKLLSSHTIGWKPTDQVSIVQYRKFMSPHPIGKMATNYHPGMFSPTAKEVSSINLHSIQNSIDTRYLLPQVVEVGNLYQHYANVHHAQDLLRYTSVAIDLGILSPQESAHFFNVSHLIPGGIEFGIYPMEVFLKIIRQIQTICIEFLKTHRPTDMDPYQRRALSFCNERLGSHLLFKALREDFGQNIPMNIFGYMHTVSADGVYRGG